MSDETTSTALGRDETITIPFDGHRIWVDCEPGVAAPNYYTDAVLDALAEWPQAPGSVLDVGTGTGVLAIAAALRWPAALVAGIDVDADAVRLAERNVARNRLEPGRCQIHLAAAGAYEEERPIDLIVANPPQIPVPPGDSNPSGAGADGTAVATEAIELAARLLAPGGMLLIALADFVPNGPIEQTATRLGLGFEVHAEGVHRAGPFTLAHRSWIERDGYRFAGNAEAPEFTLRLLVGERRGTSPA